MKLLLLFIIFLPSLTSKGQAEIRSDTNRYENGNIRDILTYKKKALINHIAFSETGKLTYQSPLLPYQRKPAYKFKSGRTYFDSKKLDTVVINDNVPEINLNVYFPGAKFTRLDQYTYFIQSWKSQPNTKKGKMVIDIYENTFFKSKRVYHKVVLIDIK